MTVRTGIPTMFDGALFRSRLEARWASFFTMLGWDWVYEPFDAERYIPDFAVTGPRPLLVEIKPIVHWTDYESVAERTWSRVKDQWSGDLLILGLSPCVTGDTSSSAHFYDEGPIAGLLKEVIRYDESWLQDSGWNAEALWMCCGKCGAWAVRHSEMSYAGRPCGHHDGDRYIQSVDADVVSRMWNEAGTATRWQKRSSPERAETEAP